MDTSKSSLIEGPKSVEAGPFELNAEEPLKLRVFVDKSIVEVFANGRQAVMRRIYPSREDSVGVAVFSDGRTGRSHDPRGLGPDAVERLLNALNGQRNTDTKTHLRCWCRAIARHAAFCSNGPAGETDNGVCERALAANSAVGSLRVRGEFCDPHGASAPQERRPTDEERGRGPRSNAGQRRRTGAYMFPFPASMKEMSSPEMVEKFRKGPAGWLTVLPPGGFRIGISLLWWFVNCLIVAVLVAYVGWYGLGPGAGFRQVFRITGTAAILGYAVGHLHESIWKGACWGTTAKFIFDGVLYGLVTAATFGWLWPGGN